MEKLKKGLLKVAVVTLLMVVLTLLYDFLVHGVDRVQPIGDIVVKSFIFAVVFVLVLYLTRSRFAN